MLIPTRYKIGAARVAFHVTMAVRRTVGKHETNVEATRRGLRWALDLREGIDFAIWLTGAFEPKTQAACRRLIGLGDVVLDIGANMGAHTLPFAQAVGPTGRVIAFEPVKAAIDRLRRNVDLNPDLAPRITAEQMMLRAQGDERRDLAFYASWPLYGNDRRHPLHRGVMQTTAGAQSLSLDDYVARARIRRIDLIKLDVDGFEPDILAGGRETLARRKPRIVLEIAPYVLAERGYTANAVVSVLKSLNYKFHDLAGKEFGRSLDVLIQRMPAGASINVVAVPH